MTMKRLLSILPVALFCTPLLADGWSIGVGTGPFVFGKYVERKLPVVTPGGGIQGTSTISLSAATRAGVSIDLQRDLTPALALGLDVAYAKAPLAAKIRSNDAEITSDDGDLAVTTVALPLVWRINRSGAFRFHAGVGPAYAIYHRRQFATLTPNSFTRQRFGAMGEAGVAWQWTPRFAVEGNVSDVVTSSPFERPDFGAAQSGLTIPRPHNVHTTVGLRYRF